MLASHLKQFVLRRAMAPASVRAFCTESTSNRLQSVDGHKSPTNEESVEGRYASVLFTAASKGEALATV